MKQLNSIKNLIYYFLKNPLIGFAFLIISFALIISVLGANIRPDASFDANNQIPQISRQPPGTTISFLKVRKNKEVAQKNFLEKLFFGGQEQIYTLEPFYDYKFSGSKIIIREFTADSSSLDYKPTYKSFELVNVINNLNNSNLSLETDYSLFINKVKNENIEIKTYYFGTDKHGRDLLSRLMAGTIISLSIGLVSVLISLFLGLFLGAVSGYFGGIVDDVILWFINVVWSIPGLLLVISLILVLGKGFVTVFIAVGLTMWVELARVVRGQVISLREMDYILAGKALGFSNYRIIMKHIIPNIFDPIIVICAANFASAILIEAGLSFLGIGVQIPTPSWGAIIDQHKEYIVHADKSYLALFPGFLIIILVFSFMILGHHLREVLSQKDKLKLIDNSVNVV